MGLLVYKGPSVFDGHVFILHPCCIVLNEGLRVSLMTFIWETWIHVPIISLISTAKVSIK